MCWLKTGCLSYPSSVRKGVVYTVDKSYLNLHKSNGIEWLYISSNQYGHTHISGESTFENEKKYIYPRNIFLTKWELA